MKLKVMLQTTTSVKLKIKVQMNQKHKKRKRFALSETKWHKKICYNVKQKKKPFSEMCFQEFPSWCSGNESD